MGRPKTKGKTRQLNLTVDEKDWLLFQELSTFLGINKVEAFQRMLWASVDDSLTVHRFLLTMYSANNQKPQLLNPTQAQAWYKLQDALALKKYELAKMTKVAPEKLKLMKMVLSSQSLRIGALDYFEKIEDGNLSEEELKATKAEDQRGIDAIKVIAKRLGIKLGKEKEVMEFLKSNLAPLIEPQQDKQKP